MENLLFLGIPILKHIRVLLHFHENHHFAMIKLGGYLGKIIALGAESVPCNGLREKWKSLKKKFLRFFIKKLTNELLWLLTGIGTLQLCIRKLI